MDTENWLEQNPAISIVVSNKQYVINYEVTDNFVFFSAVGQ
jgi:hypothetical protein